jgi:hypothetical protein
MGNLTYGDVLSGNGSEDDLVPFGGPQAHKAFALAVAFQLPDRSRRATASAPSCFVARPASDPVPVARSPRGPGCRRSLTEVRRVP